MKLSIALSAVIALFAAAVATASPAPVGNFITLHLGPTVGQFRGAVKSDVQDCIADRKVRIVRVSGDDTRVGVGFTDDRGHFSIQTSESSGDWIAKVKKTPIGNGYVCAGAQSKIKSAG